MHTKIAFIFIPAILLIGCSPVAPPMPTAHPFSPTPTKFLPTAMMTPSPISSTPTGESSLLPALQPVTPENAENVRMLRMLQFPEFKESGFSQCSLAFNPDGRLLTGACHQSTIPIWDASSSRRVLAASLPGVLLSPFAGVPILAGFLMAVTTYVGWTPVFPHAAIVARELGIPAVVGCFNATQLLQTGDRVRVDEVSGLVEILG
jgi:hypothetical protein